MIGASAERELLAPRGDVWAFVADPFRLADWWPGISGVQPDRRGFAPGARWQVAGSTQPTLFRRARAPGTVLVRIVEPYERFAFHLTGPRLDAELTLAAAADDRTRARLTVAGPALFGFNRSLPKQALAKLHALCQTGADF